TGLHRVQPSLPTRRSSDLIKADIRHALRTQYSPRHVPDEILEVEDIPYTISGKKTETPVKKILAGMDPAKAVHAGALRNPTSLRSEEHTSELQSRENLVCR